jgi:hypothetical protein
VFEPRALDGELAAVREAHAPDALVLDCARDFETLDPAVAESLGPLVDGLSPLSYPEEWLPSDAPDALRQYASGAFTVGSPGDGGVAWTRQTTPPTVLVKPRLGGSPERFVDFLLAAALVEVGLDRPEQFLGFFEARYPELDAAVALDPAATYQLAVALYEAFLGLHTREVFRDWAGAHPRLHGAWRDAGERLEPRLADLPGELARDETAFAAAAELACSAVKHGLDLPVPFGALDTLAYRDGGPVYAVRWAEKTFERLDG